MIFESIVFLTDTATLCVYDLYCLKDRLEDDADWWSIQEDEIREVNCGNVAFFGLESDGEYEINFVDEIPDYQEVVGIKVSSGRVFLGAGEEVTGEGFEPECIRGGGFLNVSPGNYLIYIKRCEFELKIAIIEGGEGKNNFTAPVRI